MRLIISLHRDRANWRFPALGYHSFRDQPFLPEPHMTSRRISLVFSLARMIPYPSYILLNCSRDRPQWAPWVTVTCQCKDFSMTYTCSIIALHKILTVSKTSPMTIMTHKIHRIPLWSPLLDSHSRTQTRQIQSSWA